MQVTQNRFGFTRIENLGVVVSIITCLTVGCSGNQSIVGDTGHETTSDSSSDPVLDGWPTDPLDTNGNPDSVVDVDSDPGDDSSSACESVLTETHYCYSILEGDIGVIGLDSGILCPLETPFTFLTHEACSHSMGYDDPVIYVCGCSDSPGVSKLDLSAGTAECEEFGPEFSERGALTSWGSGLLVATDLLPVSQLAHYTSWDAIASGDSTSLYVDFMASRFTEHEDRLYASWHSTSEVEVYHLVRRVHERTISLEEEVLLVTGLSVTEDGLLVMMDGAPPSETSIRVFSVENGKKLDVFPLEAGMNAWGLACQTH